MQNNIQSQLEKTQNASRKLVAVSDQEINEILKKIAKEISLQKDFLLSENKKDLEKMDKEDPKYDRLKLTEDRLNDIAQALIEVSEFKSPINEVLEEKELENGLKLKKIRVPLGVIGIIFEARPNVFFDCFALSFKAKNASVLKGSRDAYNSNLAIFNLIQKILRENKIDENIICFLPPEREAVKELFKAHGLVDVLIPRGSQNLINFVRENSEIPTIETGAGIVHSYVDEYADVKKAAEIIFNAKTQRPSVCNALDCLLIHEKKLSNLPEIVKKLAEKNVIIYADRQSYQKLEGHYPKKLLNEAGAESFGTEFLDYKLSIKTVENIDQALDHIAKYSSKHSEAIISENKENIEKFFLMADAAAVYSNASTRFTDGGVFGLGAEIGISTQKLHARGPMGIREITGYKWVIKGGGQVRN